MHRPPAGFLSRQNVNMCVVIHDSHFHNQDFTLLKSNLMFGLGGLFFFLSLQQTLKVEMKERKGRSNITRHCFHMIPAQFYFSTAKQQKNSFSQKSNGTIRKPTMNNKESEGEGMGQDADRI